MIYMKHRITRTETIRANSGRRLYEIDGQYSKAAAHRPFLTSQTAAREWIANQIQGAASANCYRYDPETGEHVAT